MTKPIRVEHLQALRRLVGRAKRKGREETEVAWKVTRRRGQGARLQPRLQEPAHRRRRPRRPGGAAGQARRRPRRETAQPARPAQGDPGGGAAAMNAGAAARTFRPHQRGARRHPAPAPVHSRSCRAREAGRAGPERRTGVGTAEADSQEEKARLVEGRRDPDRQQRRCRFRAAMPWHWLRLDEHWESCLADDVLEIPPRVTDDAIPTGCRQDINSMSRSL